MKISINLMGKKEEVVWGLRSYIGEITINDFKETFEVPIEFWSLEEYKKQWTEGLKKIKTGNKSCLVTRVEGENDKPSQIEWWLLYKVDGKIIIQNQLMFGDVLKKYVNNHSFTPEICYQFMKPMSRSKNVWTWVVDLE